MTAPRHTAIDWQPRLAREDDIPELEALIPASVRTLQAPYYSLAQMEAALGPVFGVDRQLIRDGTYFVVERDEAIVGCGGWSRRRSLYGGVGRVPVAMRAKPTRKSHSRKSQNQARRLWVTAPCPARPSLAQ